MTNRLRKQVAQDLRHSDCPAQITQVALTSEHIFHHRMPMGNNGQSVHESFKVNPAESLLQRGQSEYIRRSIVIEDFIVGYRTSREVIAAQKTFGEVDHFPRGLIDRAQHL